MKPNRFRARSLWLLALLPLLLAPAANAYVIERIAAVVNDRIILLSELWESSREFRSAWEGASDPAEKAERQKEVFRQVLDLMIDEILIEQQMDEMKYQVSEREVDEGIATIMANNRIPDLETLKMLLARQGISFSDYRKTVRKQLRKMNFINAKVGAKIRVSEAEVRAEYEKELSAQGREVEYCARHVLFKVKASDPPQRRAEQMKKAEAARVRIASGEPFTQVAADVSEDSGSARRGGDVGCFARGVTHKSFENAVVNLPTGGLSPVTETPFGYHVIQLTEKRPIKGRSYDEAKGELYERLRQEAIKREMTVWVKGLRKRAYIDVRLDRPSAVVAPEPGA